MKIVTILCLAFFAVGCGRAEPEPLPDPAPTAQAPAATPRMALPTNLPPEVPLPVGRQVLSYSERSDGTVALTAGVAEARDDIVAFYRGELAAQGWLLTRDSLDGGMATLAARLQGGGRLTVNIIENPETAMTMIGLSYRLGEEAP